MKKKTARTTIEQISATVTCWNGCAEFGHSIQFATTRPWRVDEDAAAYVSHSRLAIDGSITEPCNRAGHKLQLTLYQAERTDPEVAMTLNDCWRRDEYGIHIYKTYRGDEYPVLDRPTYLGLIDKVRGQDAWTAWARIPYSVMSQAIQFLSCGQTTYLSIQEVKKNRTRWMANVSVQTMDPEEE